MTQLRISDDALADLNEGFWFYEAQSPGLVSISVQASEMISRASKYQQASILSSVVTTTAS